MISRDYVFWEVDVQRDFMRCVRVPRTARRRQTSQFATILLIVDFSQLNH